MTDMASGRAERLSAIQSALSKSEVTALVCARDMNVLLLSGYWPVTGAAVAIATAEPRVLLLVPEDQEHLAIKGWADRVYTFKAASLDSLQDAAGGLSALLAQVLPPLLNQHATLGCETDPAYLPSSYVAQYVYGSALPEILREAAPGAKHASADTLLKRLRMRPTAWERERIRTACEIAARAFQAAAPTLKPGVAETDAVLPFQHALCIASTLHEDVTRADGFFYCMSGPNSAHAHAAFQQSRHDVVRTGEPVLMHCNSYIDGYWTDLTRTYVLDAPDERLSRMFDAISTARAAALDVIRPGVRASEVDKAARAALSDAGYGDAFKHATGHGVGFSAIDHGAWPRIHPCSLEILEEGMVFNVEPGIYIAGYGGVRDCNMVAVTEHGHELLSPFHLTKDDWCISP